MSVNRQQQMHDTLAGLSLFADLSGPQIESVAHSFTEEWHAAGQRVLRQGFGGTGLYVIVDGEASVQVNGDERAKLGRGEFFGEVSVLLGEPPVADVVAVGPLRVLHLPGPDVQSFLVEHPNVMFRMLQAQARRLRNANLWRS
jgi:CRP/FNR family cyclic AMP-dependent transcriptional regulator